MGLTSAARGQGRPCEWQVRPIRSGRFSCGELTVVLRLSRFATVRSRSAVYGLLAVAEAKYMIFSAQRRG